MDDHEWKEAERKAKRLARRAAEEPDAEERDSLQRKAKRLVGKAAQRKLWRKYEVPEDE